MEKILILCQKYPSEENPFSQIFIHYRLKEYINQYKIHVLSFDNDSEYIFDGIEVHSEQYIQDNFNLSDYSLLISHAPNLRNHYRFILKNYFLLKKIMFIFHGYEIIDINKRVWQNKTLLTFSQSITLAQRIYHKAKLPITFLILRFLEFKKNIQFIFVSETLLCEAVEDLRWPIFKKNINSFIINNPIAPIFTKTPYTEDSQTDFICIRPFDDSKYGVDIYIKLAENNPEFIFHLYGVGTLPETDKTPVNLKITMKLIKSEDLPQILSKYKAAILPTRWDSQGVLACEIACMGMPLITSDLKICREMLGSFENVIFLDNSTFHEVKVKELNFKTSRKQDLTFSYENTTAKEIQLLQNF